MKINQNSFISNTCSFIRDGRMLVITLSLVLAFIALSCEKATQLTVRGGNPIFVMTGSGGLGTMRIRGPEKQREAIGEAAFLYWVIENKEGQMQNVQKIGPITYGKVPEGYIQVYPEHGTAPQLIEGERYNVLVGTANADGANKDFVIRNGKVTGVSD